MKKLNILCVILLTLFVNCKNDDEQDNGKNNANDNSESCYTNTNAISISHNGINREYVLYVPNSYNGTSPVPMLLNFHGFGGSASSFMNDADMRAEAESNTFILVYPQGSCSSGSSHWNPCPTGGDNKSTADDVGFVDLMIQEISSEYTIDMERIYAAGYSNGGMMAYGLANYKSELIAAVASVSGAMLDCTSAASHPMPIIHLHGTSDGVIPYNGDSSYNAVQSTLDYWIDFNNTNTTPTVSTDNSGGMQIEQSIYNQGDNSVAVAHYKYNGGNHVWFNATYQGQSTSELIWNFVSQYDINGLR
mgnify:CR=1 FL=1